MRWRKYLNEELDRLNIEQFKKTKKIPLVVVLDNIRSKNNIGSIFRTSDAFLVEKIFLCGITSTPPDPEIHKTALGATESVEWEYYQDTSQVIEKLKNEGYGIFAVEQTEESVRLQDFVPSGFDKIAIIFGHEVRGVEQKSVDLCHGTIEIEQFGTKHSLNISVCAGIVIWELTGKLKTKKAG
jgi:23S rRNA (guanosine2251-2'-O)-methyltransferase